MTTSDWSKLKLSDEQFDYAVIDAIVPVLLFLMLGKLLKKSESETLEFINNPPPPKPRKTFQDKSTSTESTVEHSATKPEGNTNKRKWTFGHGFIVGVVFTAVLIYGSNMNSTL